MLRALILLLLSNALAASAQHLRLLQAEYFWDNDPGVGLAIPMTAADGNFNDAMEQVIANATTPVSGLHTLGVRAKGLDGTWGPTFRAIVDVVQLREVELREMHAYWDDQLYAPGTSYVDFSGPPHAVVSTSFHMQAPAAPGLHTLSMRAWGADNAWGPTFRTIVEVVGHRSVNLTQAEYFWDTDPGLGNATTLAGLDGTLDEAIEQVSAMASVTGLAVGPHVLHVRARGTDGAWGPSFRSVVHVDPQPDVTVSFDLRVALQGTMGTASLMNNTLRTNGLLPLTEPYSALGYDLGLSAGATTNASVLGVTFPPGASVVDWILVEFHPALAPWQVTARVPLLVRRGGTVSDAQGTYPFLLSLPAASYYVVVRHRNHLPVASAAPIAFDVNGATVALNFTTGAAQAYGSDAQVLAGSLYCMWAGDVDRNGVLKYVGAGNDRDPQLQAIGGVVPTNTITGYRVEDVNMDGTVKYIGAGNDRDPILVNIGGVVPTSVRVAQLP